MVGFDYYIIHNFAIILIALGMFFIILYDGRLKQKIGICSLAVIVSVILLTIFDVLNTYFSDTTSLPDQVQLTGATVFSFFGYITRPLVVYYFILLAEDRKKKETLLLLIPAGVNLIVYSLALFPATRQLVYYFFVSPETGEVHWQAGSIVIFRFMAHIVSGLYLVYLTYLSLKRLRRKHFEAAVTILICSAFIVTAVVLETFLDATNLLNITIIIACLFYYSFLHNQTTRVDTLTKLFNRAVYYRDIKAFGNKVNAVINIDMNGLKYLNDTYGHEEGDKALVSIANAIIKHETKEMYAYRLGGDEYIVLGLKVTLVELDEVCQNIKDELKDTRYSCSIGAVYKTDKNQTIEDLLKQAEIAMYKDKEEFYKTSKIERRKSREA